MSKRNLVTQKQAAAELGVTERTVRNWISRGHITGYRLPGGRAIRVDMNEVRAVVRAVPAVRRAVQPYGPKARIVAVVEPEVVEDGALSDGEAL
ncbi:helix-turn-helix domain-containing protein [Nocardiopsis quinghaiensis]|uniref:helix-turn-helix domain-containing protein n=1 Tax=Nocardiopsis quinghaiensis TaxID=464995 RepID=UPI0012392D3A|nr:helix-turn-helix domain-containing protein [Nocardiopsis quinghaiensis]